MRNGGCPYFWNWLYEINEKNPSSAIRGLRNLSNIKMWTLLDLTLTKL